MLGTQETRLRDFVVRLRARIREAQLHLQAGRAPQAVSAVQEALEFLLKAMCVVAGVDYPKKHDVGLRKNMIFVQQLLEKVPTQLSEAVDKYPNVRRYLVDESPMHLAELQHALGPASEMVEEMATACDSTVMFSLVGPVSREELLRVLFHADLWGYFYIVAKYGIEVLDAPPSVLVKQPDAALAVDHLKGVEKIVYQLQLKLMDMVLAAVVRAMHGPPGGPVVEPEST